MGYQPPAGPSVGDQAKLDQITVTQPVNLDTIESDTAANNAKVTNATHSGDAAGDGVLTIQPNAVDNSKMADMPAQTFKMRGITSGDPTDAAVGTNQIVGRDTGDLRALTPLEARTVADVYSKSEVDVLVDATLKPPEAYDPTITGNYPITYGGVGVQAGDTFRITAAQADIGGGVVTVNVEDLLIALVDTPAQVDANWMVAESNRDILVGATASVAGQSGIVPSPLAGEQDKFLAGSGAWRYPPAIIKLRDDRKIKSTTFIEEDGLNWRDARMGVYTARTLEFEIDRALGTQNVSVEIFDQAAATSLGSLTGISASGQYSFTFAKPAGDTTLKLRLKQDAGPGPDQFFVSGSIILEN